MADERQKKMAQTLEKMQRRMRRLEGDLEAYEARLCSVEAACGIPELDDEDDPEEAWLNDHLMLWQLWRDSPAGRSARAGFEADGHEGEEMAARLWTVFHQELADGQLDGKVVALRARGREDGAPRLR